MTLTDNFLAIANAIRNKAGSTTPLSLDDMPVAIDNIKLGLFKSLVFGTNSAGTNSESEIITLPAGNYEVRYSGGCCRYYTCSLVYPTFYVDGEQISPIIVTDYEYSKGGDGRAGHYIGKHFVLNLEKESTFQAKCLVGTGTDQYNHWYNAAIYNTDKVPLRFYDNGYSGAEWIVGSSAGNGTATWSDSYCEVATNGTWVYTTLYTKVDFTNMEDLVFEVQTQSSASWTSDTLCVYVGITDNPTAGHDCTWIKSVSSKATVEKNTFIFDVSDITGEHYIMYELYAGAANPVLKVYSIIGY